MSTAIEYLHRIIGLREQAQAEYNDYSAKMSALDLETQDVLHMIEAEAFDVVRGYFLAKKLKDIRIRRRYVKNHHELLSILLSNLDTNVLKVLDNKLQNKEKRQQEYKYTPRILDKVE